MGPRQVWKGGENLARTEIRSPDRPARSESLYRLSYPGPYLNTHTSVKSGLHFDNSLATVRGQSIAVFLNLCETAAR